MPANPEPDHANSPDTSVLTHEDLRAEGRWLLEALTRQNDDFAPTICATDGEWLRRRVSRDDWLPADGQFLTWLANAVRR
jgi:hypothetical protein